jgi:exopolysaccharide biosynthesis polyprenyl glycosylphosphotransferase
MESTINSINSLLDTPLSVKIYRASSSIIGRWQWRIFTMALILSDMLMVAAAFRAAYWLRFELNLPLFFLAIKPPIEQYRNLMLVLLPIWLMIFAILGLYDRKKLLGGTREYASVFNGTLVGMFVVITVGFLVPDFVVARAWLILAWLLAFMFTAMSRFGLRRIVYLLRRQGFFISPALIVGANDEGLSLARQLLAWRTSGLHILGFVDSKFPAGTPVVEGLYALGKVEQLDKLVQQYKVEELVLASSAFSTRDSLLDIFQKYGIASGVNVRLSSGLYEIITTGLNVQEFAYVPLVGINQVRLTGIDKILKLMLDYSLTLLGLLVIWPVLLGIAILIKLDTPGPVIHRRRVMGVNGRQFDAFKFRSMVVNGDEVLEKYPELQEELAKNHKLKNDPRITRIGNFIRKTSLDELTQLFNVLRGEMSLVGPRMISPEEMELYKKWGINLLTVRPGITGLWQVSGRSDISYEQRVRLDMHYIRNWSIWSDLQLLFQTLPAVIKKRGAY